LACSKIGCFGTVSLAFSAMAVIVQFSRLRVFARVSANGMPLVQKTPHLSMRPLIFNRYVE
jgi:hypothetical protein